MMTTIETSETATLRIMVDANVLIAGMTYPRFPYEVLQHALAGDYQLVLSPRIIQEAEVAVTKLFPAFAERFGAFLAKSQYEAVAVPTEEAIQAHMTLVRDVKDVHVALAAIEGKVDFLITQDRDFTDRDETTAELHQQINVILPAAFLRQHMGWTSEALEAIRQRTWSDF